MQSDQSHVKKTDHYYFEESVSNKKLISLQHPGGGSNQPPEPMMAPPAFSPPTPVWQNGVRGIRSCMYRNTYLWLNNGSSFWFFPTFIGRQAIIGFRWRGFGWVYQRINLNRIKGYQCF